MINLLKERKLTICTAESCTGGKIASKIVEEVGVSSIFKGGIVAYNNKIKTDLLDVSESMLKEKGPYNYETVTQMAISALNKFDSKVAVATSGTAPYAQNGNNDMYMCVALTDGCNISTKSRYVLLSSKLLREEWINEAANKALEFTKEILEDM